MIKTLRDFNFKGKRVLVRAGFDPPIDDNGIITDDSRIRACLPTIKYLLKKKAKIILIGHNGRPDGKAIPKLKMDKVAEKLTFILKRPVKKLDDCIGREVEKEIKKMKEQDIILLENLRFHKEEKSKNINFAKSLANLGDVFVQDAYTNAHHKDVSMVMVPKLLPSLIGLAVEKEMNKVLSIISKPKKPYIAIIGGAKPEKINTVKSLLPKADKIIVAGILATTFLKAKGINTGNSKFDKGSLAKAKKLCKSRKIILPTDAVVAENFEKNSKAKVIPVSRITKGHIMDIGPETISLFKKTLENANTIVWGGSIGVQEWSKFRKGTEEIARFIAKLKSLRLVCGGDSGEAVNSLGLAKKMTHLSIGGGATLALVEGKGLAAVKAMEESCKKFKL